MKLIQKKYNPKLEYLVCKNLLINLPNNIDEQNIKKCFDKENQAKSKYELEIIKIKRALLSKPFYKYRENDIELLYETITGEHIKLPFIKAVFNQKIPTLHKCVLFAMAINASNIKYPIILFKIILLIITGIEKHTILIPYHIQTKKIYDSILNNELLVIVDIMYQTLIYRSEKFNQPHDINLHSSIIKSVSENAKKFVEENNLLSFGIYGSFASGKANEYSDINLFIMIDEHLSNKAIRIKAEEFWYPIIPIDITFKIIKKREINKLNKQSLTIIVTKEMIKNV